VDCKIEILVFKLKNDVNFKGVNCNFLIYKFVARQIDVILFF
jgi:hypothetical protein